MSALLKSEGMVSVEEHLATEPFSEVKREYLGRCVRAMAGASDAHNIIAMNLHGLLHGKLRGKQCQAFGSDMKLRAEWAGETYFYYPAAMIVCDPSPGSRAVDEREKRTSYARVPEIMACVRIEQDQPAAIVDRRTPGGGWSSEGFSGLDAVVQVRSIGIELALADLFERVEF